jgi:RIO-like serine/threonine protein kinase
VVAIIRIAESFNVVPLDMIERLTNQKIESIRKKLVDLIREKWV